MRYQVTTALTPREALERAVVHFGPGGLGLAVTSQTPLGVIFQGGGGYVAVMVQTETETTLELETREWDYAVRQFMAQLNQRRHWWQRWFSRKRPPKPPAPPTFTILNNGHSANRPQ
jgi:hypothetical protein